MSKTVHQQSGSKFDGSADELIIKPIHHQTHQPLSSISITSQFLNVSSPSATRPHRDHHPPQHMAVLRRRGVAPSHPPPPQPADGPSATHTAHHIILIIILTLLISFLINAVSNKRNESHPAFIPFSTAPDDERTLSAHRLRLEDHTPAEFRESALVCMPTVQRAQVEYVSNAVKSFRLATRNSTSLRRIIVYNMDYPAVEPAWLENVFVGNKKTSELPSWLAVESRLGDVARPRKATHGDPWERVEWRSKEALDYAQVLQRCAEATDATWVVVVQDDVLFRHSINEVVRWAEEHVVDGVRVVNGRRVARVCAASLFDIADGPVVDGDELRSSNMVARLWRRDHVDVWVSYFKDRFDEDPVDWLADRRCRGRRGWVTVMWPNAVRHRGKVSSFSKNLREGLLT